jgi:dynein heavy chain 1
LRHTPILYIDYPSREGLTQVYNTFNKAILSEYTTLRAYSETLTKAMIDFYQRSKDRFTPDAHPHYIYSPRELSRWVSSIRQGLGMEKNISPDFLIKLWAHEGLRLFQDRLVSEEEKSWTDQTLGKVHVTFVTDTSR